MLSRSQASFSRHQLETTLTVTANHQWLQDAIGRN